MSGKPGWHHSDDAKARMREAARKRWADSLYRAKQSNRIRNAITQWWADRKRAPECGAQVAGGEAPPLHLPAEARP